MGKKSSSFLYWFASIAVVIIILLYAVNVVLGPLNQDEGWYLLAGINTAQGMEPYKDFAYTQAPVLPYFYGVFSGLWAQAGVLGGRVFTAVLGVFGLFFVSVAAYCLAPKGRKGVAAIVAMSLLGLCPVYSYFTAIPKTYALAGLFVGAGVFSLVSRKRLSFEFAAAFFALATGVRLSLGIILATVGFGLLVFCKRKELRFAWLRFGVAGAAMLALIFVPAILRSYDNFMFCQTYHVGRETPAFFYRLVLMGGFMSRILQAYFPMFALLIACALVVWFTAKRQHKVNEKCGLLKHVAEWVKTTAIEHLFVVIIALAFVATMLIHGTAPFPYDDYQTPGMPLLAVLASVLFAMAIRNVAWYRSITVAVFICIGLFALGSPMCMNWVLERQDRFWFIMQDEPQVLNLKRIGAELRERLPENALLFTQDAYLAVEAQRKVAPGLELGPFSMFDYNSWMTDDVARDRKVHTFTTLLELLESGKCPVAAISGYSFAITCPSTEATPLELVHQFYDVLERKYELVKEEPSFGQCFTTLKIYELKNEEK